MNEKKLAGQIEKKFWPDNTETVITLKGDDIIKILPSVRDSECEICDLERAEIIFRFFSDGSSVWIEIPEKDIAISVPRHAFKQIEKFVNE